MPWPPGAFRRDDPTRYRELVDGLRGHDYFMVTADFDAYRTAQATVDAAWREPQRWWHRSICNTAGVGWFSADRAIRDYANEIWNVPAAGG